ncbi:MAG: protein kinase family protein, partial [Candidatus Nanopelagicales bacterium]
MTMPRAATAALETLATGELVVEGRIAGASNATLLATAGGDLPCVYKPVRGERPLWDFPDWTLARRELAAYALSEAACWHVVPATAWREDGPAGEGMCQEWIEADPDAAPVGVVRPGRAVRKS